MKVFIVLFLLFSCLSEGYSQDWTPMNLPTRGRFDDVFFISEQVGWVAGGERGRIFHTINGGMSWTFQLTSDKYLRSIEFASPSLGFCGSLDSTLYKTVDRGKNWTDISSTLMPRPSGICGLSAPDSLHIYGCGVYRSPAFIIKSSDGGDTWSYTDMSVIATRLIDIYFLNKDTGFVTGTANPVTDGGIILYTTNGGLNWQVRYKTGINEDMVWKIQSPDNIHFFGSIQAMPFSGDTRIIKSDDQGLTWKTIQVNSFYNNVEMIGFIDSLTGWTGGRECLFKTNDGGQTWSHNLMPGSVSLNRFFRVNNRTAYLSGFTVYKYQPTITNLPPFSLPSFSEHYIQIMPNPGTGSYARLKIDFAASTFAHISLYTTDGKILAILFNGRVPAGTKIFELNLSRYAASSYFLILKTDEGLQYSKILRL